MMNNIIEKSRVKNITATNNAIIINCRAGHLHVEHWLPYFLLPPRGQTMADLVNTVWKCSLNDAAATFKQRILECERSLVSFDVSSAAYSQTNLTTRALKSILSCLLTQYKRQKSPGYVPFLTHTLFQETLSEWKSIFCKIGEIVRCGTGDAILCIEVVLGFVLLQPHLYKITSPNTLLHSLSSKILHQTNVFDIDSFKIKELIQAYTQAIHMRKLGIWECASDTVCDEMAEYEAQILNMSGSTDNKSILESCNLLSVA